MIVISQIDQDDEYEQEKNYFLHLRVDTVDSAKP